MSAILRATSVKALRGGKYAQGQGRLRYDDKFCCLGVLCDIREPLNWDEKKRIHGAASALNLPGHIRTNVGLSNEDTRMLADMNDCGDSFEQIATWIEKTL